MVQSEQRYMMAVINLRGVPDNLAAQLKSEAALAGVGYHEYCVSILECRGGSGLIQGRTDANNAYAKKIADISVGGGTTEVGGDPCLPRGGKAQFAEEVSRVSGIPIPEKLRAIKILCVRLAGERQDWQNSMAISDAPEAAAVDKEFADFCYAAGIKLDREILVRWGLAENYKPKSEEKRDGAEWVEKTAIEKLGKFYDSDTAKDILSRATTDRMAAACCAQLGVTAEEIQVAQVASRLLGVSSEDKPPSRRRKKKAEDNHGIKGRGKAGQDRGSAGGDSKANPEGDDVAQGGKVATGKPGVNMQALRDICEGKGICPAPLSAEPVEVDLCGFKAHNEEDGEWYVCTKEKHGTKVKHGEWLKV